MQKNKNCPVWAQRDSVWPWNDSLALKSPGKAVRPKDRRDFEAFYPNSDCGYPVICDWCWLRATKEENFEDHPPLPEKRLAKGHKLCMKEIHRRPHIHTPLDFTESEKCNSLSRRYISKVLLKVCILNINGVKQQNIIFFTFVSTFLLSIDVIICRDVSVKQVGISTGGIWSITFHVTPAVPIGC